MIMERARHIRDIIEDHLSIKEAEEFAKWAWGKGFNQIALRSLESINKFNELHGDKLMLKGNGNPEVDIPKMIELWSRDE